ncbi:MAG: hypothetical protein AAF957_08190 [Planctomycetota bacterium]
MDDEARRALGQLDASVKEPPRGDVTKLAMTILAVVGVITLLAAVDDLFPGSKAATPDDVGSETTTATVDLATLVGAVAWPITTLAILWWNREAIRQLATGLGWRATSVTVAGVSVQLAEATSMSLATDGAVDLRSAGTSQDISDATSSRFQEQIREPDRIDYAVVDLAEGRSWLTSRLFVLSVILARMRGLRTLVFVETAGSIRGRLLGTASCSDVRWRLAMEFPRLEKALASAERSIWKHFPGAKIANEDGRVSRWPEDPEPATQLLRKFLSGVQKPTTAAGREQEWEELPPFVGTAEHARWLDGALLEKVLGDALTRGSIDMERLASASSAVQARHVVAQPGPMIAITYGERIFDRLIDRTRTIESIARAATDPS